MRKKSFKKIVLSIVLVLSLSMQGSIQSVFATTQEDLKTDDIVVDTITDTDVSGNGEDTDLVENPDLVEVPGTENDEIVIDNETPEDDLLNSGRDFARVANVPLLSGNKIDSFNGLKDILENAQQSEIEVEIVKNIEMTDTITISNNITKLTIKSSGSTLTTGIVDGNIFASSELTNLEMEGVSFVGNKEVNSGIIMTNKNVSIEMTDCNVSNFGILNDDGTGSEYAAIHTDGSVVIVGGVYENNQSDGEGGAIYGDSVNVSGNAKFSQNKADCGGAIYGYSVNVSDNAKFSQNKANCGGAICSFELATINSSEFTENTALSEGGAIYCLVNVEVSGSSISSNTAENGGGIWAGDEIKIENNSEIINNTAEFGGGIYGSTYIKILSGSQVANNHAAENGGGLFGVGGAINIDGAGTKISNNSAGKLGGGIYANNSVEIGAEVDGNTAYQGGGIYHDTTNGMGHLMLKNATISNNYAHEGGGIYILEVEDKFNVLFVGTPLISDDGSVFLNNTADYSFSYEELPETLKAWESDYRPDGSKVTSKDSLGVPFKSVFSNYDVNGAGVKQYTVTFYLNRNASDETIVKQLYVKENNKTTEPDSTPSYSGHKFTGWSIDQKGNGGLFDFEAGVITDNLNIYAQWTKVDDGGGTEIPSTKYTITYHGNGGSGVVEDNKEYSKDSQATVKENDFTKENSAFIDWNTKADGSGTSYKEGDKIVVRDDIALYANWEDEDDTSVEEPSDPTEPSKPSEPSEPSEPSKQDPDDKNITDNDSPLGTWIQDPETGEWIFVPYETLGENPATGDVSNVFAMGMIFILALGGMVIVMNRKRRNS